MRAAEHIATCRGALRRVFLCAAVVTLADSLLMKEQGSFFVGGRTIFTDTLTGIGRRIPRQRT